MIETLLHWAVATWLGTVILVCFLLAVMLLGLVWDVIKELWRGSP